MRHKQTLPSIKSKNDERNNADAVQSEDPVETVPAVAKNSKVNLQANKRFL